MQTNSARLRYKSSVNLFFAIFLALYQIVDILLLTSPIFTDTKVGLKFGIFLLIVDVLAFIPMLFYVFYELRDDYLFVCDWPFGYYKIPYSSIFAIEDGDFKAEHKKMVGLSKNYIAIGYHKTKKNRKGVVQEIEEYMYVSPADSDSFLLFLNSKVKAVSKLENKKTEEKKDDSNDTKTEEKVTSEVLLTANNPAASMQEIENEETVKPEKTPKTKSFTKPKKTQKKKEAEQSVEVLEVTADEENTTSYFTVEEEEEKPL